MIDLRARWDASWAALGLAAPTALLDTLLARYAEPHRRYHTLQHLDECLSHLPGFAPFAAHPGEVELALWFHDAIYDTQRHDNEAESAAWARSVLLGAGGDPASAERVHSLVMVTAHHGVPASTDASIVVDVDLAILGADAARFDEYEQQVREEYGWVPAPVFQQKRREVLAGFLGRARLYGTDRGHALFEAKARANLARSIAQLG